MTKLGGGGCKDGREFGGKGEDMDLVMERNKGIGPISRPNSWGRGKASRACVRGLERTQWPRVAKSLISVKRAVREEK